MIDVGILNKQTNKKEDNLLNLVGNTCVSTTECSNIQFQSVTDSKRLQCSHWAKIEANFSEEYLKDKIMLKLIIVFCAPSQDLVSDNNK